MTFGTEKPPVQIGSDLWDASLDLALENDVPLEAQELIDSYLGRAGMLANAIMMGLTEPDVEINPDVMLALGAENTERGLALDPEDMRTTTRVVRAVKWATRDDVQPETALAFYGRVYGFINGLAHAETMDDTDEKKPVLSAMMGFGIRFRDTAFKDFVFPNPDAAT